MPYTEFQASDAYLFKLSGSHVAIVIYDQSTPGAPIVNAATGINWSEDYETLPVEEAGQKRATEIVQGRYRLSGTISALFTPQRNDALLTADDFIGREFVIMEVIAPERPGAGEVLNVFEGAKLSRVGSSHGARGLKTTDLAFEAEIRYSGAQWQARAAA